jgi:hypothetical protein
MDARHGGVPSWASPSPSAPRLIGDHNGDQAKMILSGSRDMSRAPRATVLTVSAEG